MSSALKNLSEYDETNLPDAAGLKMGIAVADWNKEITHALFEGCYDTYIKHGVKPENIYVIQVPGTFELTFAAQTLIARHHVNGVACLGCVIKGETSHNEYINHAVANGITNLSIKTGVPVIFGVLTPNDWQQAEDRAGGKHGNKGVEAGYTALRMALI